jgi:hypothetical protein
LRAIVELVARRAQLVILLLAPGLACGRLGFDAQPIARDGAAPADAADAADASLADATSRTSRSQLVLARDPGELLADFPLLVVLDDTRAARDLMLPDASDLRFYDASGAVLPYEIEQLGEAGGPPLVAWVRVPAISGSATTLTVDYADGTPPPLSTDSVWSATYRGVWHLADLHDSTSNHHDATWLGGLAQPTEVAGLVGPTAAFDGSSAGVVADAADLAFTDALTVSGWIEPSALDDPDGYTCITSRQNGSNINDDFWIGADNGTALADSVVSTPTGTQIGGAATLLPIALGAWTGIAMTFDGSAERLYVGGQPVKGTSASGDDLHGSHPILLGADHNSASASPADADFVHGMIDEVRIEATVRSPAWLAYDHASVLDQLITYGPVTR